MNSDVLFLAIWPSSPKEDVHQSGHLWRRYCERLQNRAHPCAYRHRITPGSCRGASAFRYGSSGGARQPGCSLPVEIHGGRAPPGPRRALQRPPRPPRRSRDFRQHGVEPWIAPQPAPWVVAGQGLVTRHGAGAAIGAPNSVIYG